MLILLLNSQCSFRFPVYVSKHRTVTIVHNMCFLHLTQKVHFMSQCIFSSSIIEMKCHYCSYVLYSVLILVLFNVNYFVSHLQLQFLMSLLLMWILNEIRPCCCDFVLVGLKVETNGFSIQFFIFGITI